MSNGGRRGPSAAQSSHQAPDPITGSEHTSTLGSTEPTGTSSSSFEPFPSLNADLSNANSSQEDGRLKILSDLEGVVESFRGGKASKTETVSSIIRILGENTDVTITPSQKEATFDSYLTEILAIQSALDKPRVPPGDEASKEPPITPRHRRDLDDLNSEPDSETGSPSKRLKLNESDMPWFVAEGGAPGNTSSASCQETCRLLRAYNRDVSKAKFLVKIAPNCPSGIPSSQWERILKGEAVDLNQFFASLHHVVPDEERTGRLGDTEITFGVAEPKKRISTAAEWSSAWRRASKAISFAFPHRREELLEYGDYIESEFAAKIISSHHKLLLYDIALRNEVAAGQQTLLTDFHKFSRLYSAIVLPDGVESGGPERERQPGKKPRNQKGDKPEICNKFNAGTCKNLPTECKYRHVCKSCGKTDHGKKDCPDGNK